MKLLICGLGGAIGSMARYLCVMAATRLLPTEFPFGTLIVNVVGSAMMGIVVESFAQKSVGSSDISKEILFFLTVGVLGGFTTFSAFSNDFVLLLQKGFLLKSFTYLVSSVGLSIFALYMGVLLVRSIHQ